MFKRALFFVLIISMLLTGCGTMGEMYPNRCDTIESPSRLCTIAENRGMNLSMIADGLGLANLVAIEKGLYTKDQARSALVKLRLIFESPVSYAGFRLHLTKITEGYPLLFNTVQAYLDLLVDTRIMYKADQDLIKGWIDRLILSLE